MATNEKMDWNKFVSESKGRAIFLPAEFKKQMEEVEEMRKKHNASLNEIARNELFLAVKNNQLYFEVRKFLEKNGYPEIWMKEVGFNVDALNEGKYIMLITDQNGKTL